VYLHTVSGSFLKYITDQNIKDLLTVHIAGFQHLW
jgi:hypothetical protein